MSDDKPVTMKDAAKALNIGHRKLFSILREEGILSKQNNLPRKDLVQAGYFKTEERSFRKGGNDYDYGIPTPYIATLVTLDGILFINDILQRRQAQAQAANS